MSTENKDKLSRAESSRINGAKSHGPATPEGRAISCLNHTTHGMHSSRVVLRSECQQTYDDLHFRFTNLFLPKDIFEQELVTNIVNARWRIRRLEAASTANLDLAIEEARPEFEKNYENIDATHHHAIAYRAIAQSTGNADLMGRHEDRQHRIFERSYRLLARHRGKLGALPSPQDLAAAECSLPHDNLPPAIPLQTEVDSSLNGFEPEPPPPAIIVKQIKPKSRKSANSTPETDDDALFEQQYEALKPLFDAVKHQPELRDLLIQTLGPHIAA